MNYDYFHKSDVVASRPTSTVAILKWTGLSGRDIECAAGDVVSFRIAGKKGEDLCKRIVERYGGLACKIDKSEVFDLIVPADFFDEIAEEVASPSVLRIGSSPPPADDEPGVTIDFAPGWRVTESTTQNGRSRRPAIVIRKSFPGGDDDEILIVDYSYGNVIYAGYDGPDGIESIVSPELDDHIQSVVIPSRHIVQALEMLGLEMPDEPDGDDTAEGIDGVAIRDFSDPDRRTLHVTAGVIDPRNLIEIAHLASRINDDDDAFPAWAGWDKWDEETMDLEEVLCEIVGMSPERLREERGNVDQVR